MNQEIKQKPAQPSPPRSGRMRRGLVAGALALGLTGAGLLVGQAPASAQHNCTNGATSGGFLIAHWPRSATSAYFQIYSVANGTATIVCYSGTPIYDWIYG